jgi:hypothetical protein
LAIPPPENCFVRSNQAISRLTKPPIFQFLPFYLLPKEHYYFYIMSETVEVVDAEFSQPSLVPSFNSMESLEPTDSASQVSPNDSPVKFVD